MKTRTSGKFVILMKHQWFIVIFWTVFLSTLESCFLWALATCPSMYFATNILCAACRYNTLLKMIHQSLKDLLKALKGLVVMSQSLEEMANSLFINHVPDMWAGKVCVTGMEKGLCTVKKIQKSRVKFGRSGAKTIKKSRACLGAKLTICAQKLRNFICSSTLSLRFVWSRVCVFLYILGSRLSRKKIEKSYMFWVFLLTLQSSKIWQKVIIFINSILHYYY